LPRRSEGCDCGGVPQAAHPVVSVGVDATIVELCLIAAAENSVYGLGDPALLLAIESDLDQQRGAAGGAGGW
jgi:hypothetical protein